MAAVENEFVAVHPPRALAARNRNSDIVIFQPTASASVSPALAAVENVFVAVHPPRAIAARNRNSDLVIFIICSLTESQRLVANQDHSTQSMTPSGAPLDTRLHAASGECSGLPAQARTAQPL